MRKNILFRTFSVLLAVALFAAISPAASAYTYDGDAAKRYADTYALSHNSSYRQFSGDCANFVSQCLYAGGLQQNDTWFYKNGYFAGIGYSEAWATADTLKNYLKNDLKATRLVSKWTNDGRGRSYAYINNSGNLSGDGTEIIFYDWNDDGIIDHTAICVGTGYPLDGPRYYSDLIDQHTTNRKHVTWHLDYFNQNRNSTAIYAFGL